MTAPDPESVRAMVAQLQDTTLSEASARRVARILQGARRTLEAVAAQSMFDTEPAQFVRALETLAGRSDRNG